MSLSFRVSLFLLAFVIGFFGWALCKVSMRLIYRPLPSAIERIAPTVPPTVNYKTRRIL